MFAANTKVSLLIVFVVFVAVGNIEAVTVSYDQICDSTNICDTDKKLTCSILYHGCNKGKCRCSAGKVWSEDDQMCQILSEQNGQCGDNANMFGCKDGMSCIDNICNCANSMRYIADLGCVDAGLSVLTETCRDNDACYDSLECTGDPKTCTCPAGRIDAGNQDCRKPKLDETGCVDNNDCEGSLMRCVAGKCKCEVDAVPKAYRTSCKAVGTKHWSESCTGYEECYGRMICRNCEQTDFDICRIPNSRDDMLYLEPCDATRKCDGTKQLVCRKHFRNCPTGTCVCPDSMVWSIETQTCQTLNPKDGQCNDDNNFYACQNRLTCSNKVCGCSGSERYIKDLGCIDDTSKVLGETCTDDDSCYGSMECTGDPKKCTCPEGRINAGNKNCRKPKNTEKGCVTSTDCSGTNLKCSSGKCQCITDYVNHADTKIGCKESGTKAESAFCVSSDQCEGSMICRNCENSLTDICRIPIIRNSAPLFASSILTWLGIVAFVTVIVEQ